MLQEGVIGVDKDFLKMNNGEQPPVIHVDSTAPLYSDKTKKLITDKIWGIYYKPDIEGLVFKVELLLTLLINILIK